MQATILQNLGVFYNTAEQHDQAISRWKEASATNEIKMNAARPQ